MIANESVDRVAQMSNVSTKRETYTRRALQQSCGSLRVKLGSRKKQKFDFELSMEPTVQDLALVLCWYGSMSCFTCLHGTAAAVTFRYSRANSHTKICDFLDIRLARSGKDFVLVERVLSMTHSNNPSAVFFTLLVLEGGVVDQKCPHQQHKQSASASSSSQQPASFGRTVWHATRCLK